MTMHNSFEQRIAYEIGIKLAQEQFQKESSLQAARAFGSGLKGVFTGQGKTLSEAFQTGAKSTKGGYEGATNFKGVLSEIGSGLAKPWREAYRTYGAKRHQRIGQQATDKVKTTRDAFRRGPNKGSDAARAEMRAAETARDTARANRQTAFGSTEAYNKALNQNVIRKADGTLNWGNIGTMATGAGLAAGGTYLAGNALFGGGDTYVNQVQPQTAPHEYYMNQLKGYFN